MKDDPVKAYSRGFDRGYEAGKEDQKLAIVEALFDVKIDRARDRLIAAESNTLVFAIEPGQGCDGEGISEEPKPERFSWVPATNFESDEPE